MNLLQNFHLSIIEYLYRGRRAVSLQTFTASHSNRKLSIFMALSTTFTQYPSEITKYGKIRAISLLKVIQGYQFWYQSKAHIRLSIRDYYQLTSYLAPFRSYSIPNVKNRYILLPLLRLNPPTEGFPWDDLRKIFSECQWMVKVPDGKKNCGKFQLSRAHQRYRQTERR